MTRIVTLLSAIAAAVTLSACSAHQGGCKWTVGPEIQTRSAHNLDTKAVVRGRWKSGAEVQGWAGRQWRVDEPSTRGYREENILGIRYLHPIN